MKLTSEIKEKIDNFFANISSEELLDLAIKKYGFVENTDIEVVDYYSTVSKEEVHLEGMEIFQSEDKKGFTLAA